MDREIPAIGKPAVNLNGAIDRMATCFGGCDFCRRAPSMRIFALIQPPSSTNNHEARYHDIHRRPALAAHPGQS